MALFAPWLADIQLLAAALLLGVMLAIALLRQPAQRMAVAKSTLVALAALALLCAIPGWSLIHLLNEPPTPVALVEPVPSPTAAFEMQPPTPQPQFDPSTIAMPSIAAPTAPPIVAEPTVPIDWPAAIVALYAAGSAAVTLWLIAGALLANRVRRQATAAPAELQDLLQQVCGPDSAIPQLLISNRIAAPVAMGLLRPTILLPLPRREGLGEGFPTHQFQSPQRHPDSEPKEATHASQASLPTSTFPIPHSAFRISPTQLLPILAHEWAHLQHRDLNTLAATRLLLILLWPQPLFWLLRRTIRLDQETLADAAAADRAGRLDYAQQLLAWARTASTQRPPRLAGAVGLWEGPSQLKRRIAVLLNEQFAVMRSCSTGWRRVCIATLGIAAVALSLVTLQPTPVSSGANALSAEVTPGDDMRTRISGRIVMEDGSPATVSGWLDSDSSHSGDSIVRAEGQFSDRFSIQVRPGEVWLKHFTDEFAPAWVGPLQLEPDRPIDEVILRLSPGFSVPIEVVSERGQPVPRARVSALPTIGGSTDGPPVERITDERGRYLFQHVADLNYAIEIKAPGFMPLRVAAVKFQAGQSSRFTLSPDEPNADSLTPLSAAPAKPTVISGRFVTEDGKPTQVDGQLEYVSSRPGFTSMGTAGRFSGTFSFDCPSGDVWLLYITEEFAPASLGPLRADGTPSSEVEIKLTPGFSLPIEVVNEQGRPISGANFSAFAKVSNGSIGIPMVRKTDESGRYLFRHVATLDYAIEVTAPNYEPLRVDSIEFKPDTPVRYTLVPAKPTTGVIQNADGSAAAGARLRFRSEVRPGHVNGGGSPYGEVVATADDQGRFALDGLATGSSYLYIAETADGARAWSPAVRAGEKDIVIRVPPRRDLRVQVVGDVGKLAKQRGKPTVSVQQRYRFRTKQGNCDDLVGDYATITPTAAGGEFAYEGLLPGEVEISSGEFSTKVAVDEQGVTEAVLQVAPKPGTAPATPPTDSERQAKEVVERGSALVKQLVQSPNLFMGFCIDEAGQPLADIDVSLFVYEGATASENIEPIARVRTDADGKFEFDQLIDVAKEFPDGVPEDYFATAPVKIIAAVAKAPGLATEFRNEALYQFVKRGQAAILQMKPAQRLTGRVTDDNGQPVANAVVTTTLSAGGFVPGGNLSVRTDAEGRYTIDDLPRFDAAERDREYAAARERKEPWAMMRPPGPMLSVQHPNFAAHRVSLEAIPGEVDVALLPGATIKGRVVAKSSPTSDDVRPLANVPIWITRTTVPIIDPRASYALVEQQQAMTDADGNYSFASLPAGGYSLTATAPDLTTVGVTGVGGAGGQTTIAPDVVLTPGAILRTKLLDAATKQPLKLRAGQKGYVISKMLTPGALRKDSTITTFTANGVGEVRLAPGRYELFVSIPGEGGAPNLESHSPDGESTVAEFEVREGETLDLDVPLVAFPLQAASGITASLQPAVAAAAIETQTSPQPATSFFQTSPTPADGEQPGVVPVKPQSDIPVIEGSSSPDPKTPATAYPAASPKTTHQSIGMGRVASVALDPPKHQPNALQLHVVDERNQPLAGVEATLYSVMPPINEAKAIRTLATDDAGNAVFADVAPADQVARFEALRAAGEFIGGSREMYLIALKHPGLATALLYQSAGELALGGSKRTIMLRPAAKLSGQVTDPEGKPVADAVVTAGGFSGSLSIPGVNAVSTDAAGRFEFTDRGPFNRAAANEDNNLVSFTAGASSAAPQPAAAEAEDPTVKNVSDLVVTHPEFAVTRIEGGDVPGNADVQMLAATSIVGRVVDHKSGAPAASVTVQTLGDPTGPPQIEKEDNVLAYRIPYSHSASARTDAQGNYRLENLPAGTYNLWVDFNSTPGKPFKQASQGASGIMTSAGGDPTRAPDILVGPPATVTAQLVDADTGKPLQLEGNAVAIPMALRGSDYRQQQNPHQRVPISKEGTFTFSSLPGRFRIGVEVVDKPGVAYQTIYRSGDDFDRSAAAIDLGFGENVSTKLAVRPMAQLEQLRAEHGKAFSLLQAKKFDEAIAIFNKMVAARPDDYEPISSRCYAYRTAGRYAESIADAEAMLKRFPDDSQGKYVLADLLATSPIAETRDGKRALKYAEELVATAKANHAQPVSMAQSLAFVAAAYAESGEFAKAVASQQQALDLVPSSQNESVHRTLAERLELYRANKPFHRDATMTPTTPSKPSADQGASNARRLAPIIFKPVELPPISPTMQSTASRAVVQSADIQAVSLIDRIKPNNYSAWELKTERAPIDLKATATLGDAIK